MDWFKQGGAAFPIPHSNEAGAPGSEHGMSLRDWFAGQALSRFKFVTESGKTIVVGDNVRETVGPYCKNVAELVYALADAMLAERAK